MSKSNNKELRFMTIAKPHADNFNLTSHPRIALKFAEEFLENRYDYVPGDVDVEYCRCWMSVFDMMERNLRDNPDMIGESLLPLILDTAIMFFTKGYHYGQSGKPLKRFKRGGNNE